ncbi:hypothetical protein NFX31_16895 [Microbacterium azadirachtae]|uniref:hypothetical protein n=1 Tax=Microbacterium azadirachtae TaxID=582680 RepID=UPI0021D4D79D|nr:hypothetical protein [Microbacterium azadirachtae]UXW85855.1 hypothetical protein NFX31_16895 [Microbacterium azadirachtae]
MTSEQDPAARIARLEAENDALRRGIAHGAGSRWRSAASAVLIVIGLLLGSVSAVTSYARDLLTDTDQFVATFAPLAADPAVQSVLVRATNDVIDQQVDIPGLTADVFDGLRSLDLPPRASTALGLLEAPVAQGARNLVRGMVENVITSPAFSDIWNQALRVSHAQAVAALQGDPGSAVVAGTDGALTLQLGPILEGVRTRLLAEGVTFAQGIPTTDRSIVLVHDASLGTAVAAYGIVVTVSAWLPWVALALLVAGVVVARRRRRAVLAAGVAAVVIMVALLAAVAVGRAVGIGALASNGSVITPAAAGDVFDQITQPLTQRLLALGLLALVIALVAWVVGASRPAIALRAAGGRLASAARPGGGGSDATAPGARLGVWIDRSHRGILIVVALVAAAVVLLVHPLTAWLVLWVLLGAVLVLIAVELLRRPASQ